MPHARVATATAGSTPGLIATLAVALALGAAGCGPKSETAAPAALPEPVVNRDLGLTLDDPASAGFQLAANEGTTLELSYPPGDGREGAHLTFEVGEPQLAGVNLIDAVNAQKAAIEAHPDGRFLGQVQLGSQIGTAFSTRGRYTGDDGREVEEVRLLAVHPAGDRLLALVYRYHPTPGDTKERINQAMAALGLVQPPPAPGGEAASPGEG